MTKASHGFLEVQKRQIINLEGVWSLWVYNNGDAIAVIDGFLIYPKQKATIIASDNCYCDVSILVTFKPLPGAIEDRPSDNYTKSVYIPEINPEPIAPEVRQSVIFYIKKNLQ